MNVYDFYFPKFTRYTIIYMYFIIYYLQIISDNTTQKNLRKKALCNQQSLKNNLKWRNGGYGTI